MLRLLLPLLFDVAQAADGAHPMATVEELDAARRAGVPLVVVDVRTTVEYALGHVEGSVHIPVGALEARLAELEPYRQAGSRVYLMCMTGHRSVPATELLVARGYDAWDVAGGWLAWRKAGLPAGP